MTYRFISTFCDESISLLSIKLGRLIEKQLEFRLNFQFCKERNKSGTWRSYHRTCPLGSEQVLGLRVHRKIWTGLGSLTRKYKKTSDIVYFHVSDYIHSAMIKFASLTSAAAKQLTLKYLSPLQKNVTFLGRRSSLYLWSVRSRCDVDMLAPGPPPGWNAPGLLAPPSIMFAGMTSLAIEGQAEIMIGT